MTRINWPWRHFAAGSGLFALGMILMLLNGTAQQSAAWTSPFGRCWNGDSGKNLGCAAEGTLLTGEPGGTWYWLRSPEEEKRVVIGLFNRYCIRCHGVDGRGVWDIPDVPDFTNARWQSCRSDGQLARAILEGRGAVMPPFRGTLTLEEAWAMARYLRTFMPGTEVPRPELGQAEKATESLPAPKQNSK
jgi:mono/diheme cytochrome c family protein